MAFAGFLGFCQARSNVQSPLPMAGLRRDTCRRWSFKRQRDAVRNSEFGARHLNFSVTGSAPMNHPSAPVLRWVLLGLALTFASVDAAERSARPAAERRAVSGYFPPPDSAGGWREAKDVGRMAEQAGMSLGRLEQAWEFTRRCTQHGGLLVVRRGWLVFERY